MSFVAFADGQPIGQSMAYLAADAVGIFGVGVVGAPAPRGPAPR